MFTIRCPHSPAEWAETRAVLLDNLEWMRAALGVDLLTEQPPIAAELADLAGSYGEPDAAMFVAVTGPDDLVVGMIGVRCHPDGTAELKRMYVRSVARRQGLGEALVAAAVDFARERGAHSMWLETARGAMDPAIALYARNGFTEVDERPGGLRIDELVVMKRSLDPVACRS